MKNTLATGLTIGLAATVLTLACSGSGGSGINPAYNSSDVESMNNAQVVPTERYTLKVTIGKTYFKISTAQSNTLNPETELCTLVEGDVIKYKGVLTYEGMHVKLTLDDLALPQCPFRTGYLFGQHFEDNNGTATTEYVYPLAAWAPTCDEAGGGAGGFGAGRDGGARKHAGCDLYSSAGRPIYAVEDGVVLDSYPFYCDTDALEVKGSRVIRYGEIRSGSPLRYNVRVGETVKKGQIIAEVGQLSCYYQPMLHFELFSGNAWGPLTDRGNSPYQRRSDLLDPTQGLLQWRKARFEQ